MKILGRIGDWVSDSDKKDTQAWGVMKSLEDYMRTHDTVTQMDLAKYHLERTGKYTLSADKRIQEARGSLIKSGHMVYNKGSKYMVYYRV